MMHHTRPQVQGRKTGRLLCTLLVVVACCCFDATTAGQPNHQAPDQVQQQQQQQQPAVAVVTNPSIPLQQQIQPEQLSTHQSSVNSLGSWGTTGRVHHQPPDQAWQQQQQQQQQQRPAAGPHSAVKQQQPAAVPAAVPAAEGVRLTKQQQQQQPQKSTTAPIINGWSDLRTTANVVFTWTHQLFPQSATSFTVPWGYGAAVANIGTTFTRSVASAQYSFSGNLAITNPDPSLTMFLNQLQLQCFWGASVNLPCGNSGSWMYGTMQIGPGQTSTCYISNQQIYASFGMNFRQPCRVIATSWNGLETSSGDFTLDFSSPTVNNQANNCVLFSVACSVTPAQYYNPSIGGLPQGQLQCDTETRGFEVGMGGGFIGDGTATGSCGTAANVNCRSQAVMQTTIGSNPGSGGTVPGSISLQITPSECPAPKPPPAAPPSPPPTYPPGFQDRPEPKLSVTVTKTYMIGNYRWSVTSSVTPTRLDIFAGSSSTAQYKIAATRTIPKSQGAQYLVEGAVQVANPSDRAIALESVSAVLPGGAAASAVCSDQLQLPGTLNPWATATCTFRIGYAQGPSPGSISAQAVLAGSSTPVASGQSTRFGLRDADTEWSTGQCARIFMAFMADPGMSLSLIPGGRAPAFAGAGVPATEVCDSSTFDFMVQFSPGSSFQHGETQVFGKVTVTPTTGSSGSADASSIVDVVVLEWPATWDAHATTAVYINTTSIPSLGLGWYTYIPRSSGELHGAMNQDSNT